MLDLAKVHMYNLFYRFHDVNDSIFLVYTDTDSMVLGFDGFRPEDVRTLCRMLQANEPMFDYSNLAKDDPDYDVQYRARLGFLKHEWPLHTIVIGFFPMPKTYLLKCINARGEVDLVHHAKGMPKYVARRLTEDDFEAQKPIRQSFMQMKPTNLRVFHREVEKLGVSFIDIKSNWVNGEAVPFFF